MIVALALSFAISTGLGLLLLRLMCPRGAGRPPAPLIVAFGAGLGAGLSSVLLFLWMLAFGPTPGFRVAEAVLLVVAALAVMRRARREGPDRVPVSVGTGGDTVVRVLALAFLVAAGAAVLAFGSSMLQRPHGDWDAWMNWNMRARMFFRGGEAWRAAFSAEIPWSHPDYPVLLPSLVARTWLYAGRETLLGPSLVAATFTFGTVALLATALAALRTVGQGILAGLLLVATPFFLVHGTALYADVPLGFFFLATFVCLALDARHGAETSRFLVLAGMAAGLAMWTKNEGLLFTLGTGAGILLAHRHEGRGPLRRRVLGFGAGALPFLLLTVAFKLAFAPPNDLVSTLEAQHTLGRVTSLDRYVITLRGYVSHIAGFGANGVGSGLWVLAVCLLGLGVNRAELSRPWVRGVAAGLVLILAGHFVVFVSMAHELSRLIASSLDRLLLQLWPGVLFLFFVVSRAPEEVSRPGERAGAAGVAP
jgi:hypothetical protein